MNWYKKANGDFTIQDVQVNETANAGGQPLIRFEIPNVGGVEINEWKGVYILDDMDVSEQYRRRGIGTLLLQAVKNYANMKGKKVQLTPISYEPENLSNEDLSQYYQKSGFVPLNNGQTHTYDPNAVGDE